MIKIKILLPLTLIGLLSQSIYSQGILLNDEILRADLNWLNQQNVIQISTSTWPLSGDEIERVLKNAQISNSGQQKVIDQVHRQIAIQNGTFKLNLFAESNLKDIPQNFADQQKSQYQIGAEFNVGGENWDAKLKVNGEKKPQIDHGQNVNFEGTYLAGKLWNQWLIAGQIPTYWGPGHDGSLIRGDAVRPVYGFTMQRATQQAFETKWLSWIGPWQYQAFAGKLDDYRAIPNAKLLGFRLTAQPFESLELGASRTFQWGGEGRPESWSSLWNAIKGNDNDGTGPDKSNQLAGFDARLNLKHLTHLPLSLYGQYIGEDEAGLLPAKKMYLAGLDYSSSVKNLPFQLYMEWADTRTNGKPSGISYNHHIYKDGYYQHGFPLGHAMGGDGQMISLGGHIQFDAMNRLNGRVIYAKLSQNLRSAGLNDAFPEQDKLKALDLTWTHYLQPDLPLKINGWLSDSDVYGKDAGASIGIEIPISKHLFR